MSHSFANFFDDAPQDFEDNFRPVSDFINSVLERQAVAIEQLAVGMKEIAEALRCIAVAMAHHNLQYEEYDPIPEF